MDNPHFIESSPTDHRRIANEKTLLRRKKLLFSAKMRRIYDCNSSQRLVGNQRDPPILARAFFYGKCFFAIIEHLSTNNAIPIEFPEIVYSCTELCVEPLGRLYFIGTQLSEALLLNKVNLLLCVVAVVEQVWCSALIETTFVKFRHHHVLEQRAPQRMCGQLLMAFQPQQVTHKPCLIEIQFMGLYNPFSDIAVIRWQGEGNVGGGQNA